MAHHFSKVIRVTVCAGLFSLTFFMAPLYADLSSVIDYISGGVGEEGRAELEAIEKNYNLKLIFVGQAGIYLDDVHVVITDAHKRVMLDTDSQGPILLATLPPGHYSISADAQEHHVEQSLTIKKSARRSDRMHAAHQFILRFPISD